MTKAGVSARRSEDAVFAQDSRASSEQQHSQSRAENLVIGFVRTNISKDRTRNFDREVVAEWKRFLRGTIVVQR